MLGRWDFIKEHTQIPKIILCLQGLLLKQNSEFHTEHHQMETKSLLFQRPLQKSALGNQPPLITHLGVRCE